MRKNVLEHDPRLAVPFIKEFEGLALKAYRCPAGKLTIGYGHTGPLVTKSQTITKEDAEGLLLQDLQNTHDDVHDLVKVPVTENQFIALMSFVYNFGITKCRKYTLFKMINAENNAGIREWWPKYCNPGSEFEDGLKKRRLRELGLFFS